MMNVGVMFRARIIHQEKGIEGFLNILLAAVEMI
jgi:hypothetical protein